MKLKVNHKNKIIKMILLYQNQLNNNLKRNKKWNNQMLKINRNHWIKIKMINKFKNKIQLTIIIKKNNNKINCKTTNKTLILKIKMMITINNYKKLLNKFYNNLIIMKYKTLLINSKRNNKIKMNKNNKMIKSRIKTKKKIIYKQKNKRINKIKTKKMIKINWKIKISNKMKIQKFKKI